MPRKTNDYHEANNHYFFHTVLKISHRRIRVQLSSSAIEEQDYNCLGKISVGRSFGSNLSCPVKDKIRDETRLSEIQIC